MSYVSSPRLGNVYTAMAAIYSTPADPNMLMQVVESWIQSLECFEHRSILTSLFAKYIETTADYCRRNFKTVVPLPLVNQVQTVCKVMEGFLPQVHNMGFHCAPLFQ